MTMNHVAPGVGLTKGSVWFAMLAGILMVIGVAVVFWGINERAQQHAHLMNDNAARMNQLLIQQDIGNRLSALGRLADRWTAGGGTPRKVWEADAARYVADMQGFQAIQWADSELRIRWVVPLAGDESPGIRELVQKEERTAVIAAQKSGRASLSEPFELSQGELGVAVYVPVFRDGTFDGVIIGVLHLESWLETVLGAAISSDQLVGISVQGYEVYRYNARIQAGRNPQTVRIEFSDRGLEWTIVVAPNAEFLSSGYADSSIVVLIVGLLLSIAVAVVVYLALVARSRSRQLHHTAVRLETLLQNLPGMAYRYESEPNRRMEFVSAGCEELSGYSRSDFENQRVIWRDLIHLDDQDLVSRKMQQAIDNSGAYEVEYRITAKSKNEKWVWERGRVAVGAAPAIIQFEGFVSDVSRRRAAETEARQQREQLAHMDRIDMLGEMATGIAHEINQPLTAISLFADAGKRLFDAGKQDRLPQILEKLSLHAHRAGAVIERMQSMARKQEREKAIVDCNTLVLDVAKLAEAEARIRDMSIAVETASNLPAIDVDTVQIQQVALNLLRNAMEAMRSDAHQFGNVVRLRTRYLGDGIVEIAVIDTGEGVSEEVAELLFTPFSTTKESGLGMGLSISRAIITAHGGQLDFRNNEFGGATFFFTLPAAEPEDEIA